MKYVIDPFLFSFSDKMSEDELLNYVDTLSRFDKWWKCHKEDMYTFSDMETLLYDNGFFPVVEKLAPLLEQYDSDIEYRDISRMMNHYIDQTSFIDIIQDSELLEKKSITLDASTQASIKKRPQDFQEAFNDVLWHIIRNNIVDQNNEIESYIVFVKDIDQAITVDVNYEQYEENGDEEVLADKNTQVIINCHSTVDNFFADSQTPFYLWRYAQNRDDLDFGLRCRVFQEDRLKNISDVNKKYTIYLQDSFYEDYFDNRYSNRPSDIRSALDSMMKAVKSIRHGKEHNMRIGPGGNDPYVFHGDYAGMRKNVTTSIKLHYWRKTPYNKFAKIGEHDFFDIPWEDDINLSTLTSTLMCME